MLLIYYPNCLCRALQNMEQLLSTIKCCNYFQKCWKLLSERLRNPCKLQETCCFFCYYFKLIFLGFTTLYRPLSFSLSSLFSLLCSFCVHSLAFCSIHSFLLRSSFILSALLHCPLCLAMWLPTNCKQAEAAAVDVAADVAAQQFRQQGQFVYCVKIMKPCEVGHSKTLPAPRAAAKRRRKRETEGWANKRGNSFPLARSFSPTPILWLSCLWARVECVCLCDCGVCVWVECECGLCATPVEMLAAVGSIALAQPSAARGRAEILRKSFIMSPMAAL